MTPCGQQSALLCPHFAPNGAIEALKRWSSETAHTFTLNNLGSLPVSTACKHIDAGSGAIVPSLDLSLHDMLLN